MSLEQIQSCFQTIEFILRCPYLISRWNQNESSTKHQLWQQQDNLYLLCWFFLFSLFVKMAISFQTFFWIAQGVQNVDHIWRCVCLSFVYICWLWERRIETFFSKWHKIFVSLSTGLVHKAKSFFVGQKVPELVLFLVFRPSATCTCRRCRRGTPPLTLTWLDNHVIGITLSRNAWHHHVMDGLRRSAFTLTKRTCISECLFLCNGENGETRCVHSAWAVMLFCWRQQNLSFWVTMILFRNSKQQKQRFPMHIEIYGDGLDVKKP